ncbi:MAG: hypothetical protein D6702_07030 [Planctomycetota bacterium]|nr:MAG: hypothetical protein D6702_07030 [Planctomycetota bacterium]
MRLVLLTALLLPAAPLAAQDPPDNAELARRIDLLAEELEGLRNGREAIAVQDRYGLGPAAAKVYAVDAGPSLGGYGEALYQGYSGNGAANRFDLYRLVLYVGYRFSEDWVFNSEIEFEHVDQAAVEMAYLDHLIDPAVNLRAGHLLVPMGWINETHEPTTFWSANRPQVERLILPTTWHENGVGIHGQAGGLEYRSYLMNGFDASTLGADLGTTGFRKARQGGGQAKAENLAWTGRLDWTGTPGLIAGASAWLGDADQTVGAGPHFPTTILEVHAQYDWEALRLRGLWARGELDGATTLGNPSDRIEGWYLEAGWDLLAGRERELVPFLRYSESDLAVGSPVDRAATWITAGLAWKPLPQAVFKLDYQRQDPPGSAEVDVLEVAAGWAF